MDGGAGQSSDTFGGLLRQARRQAGLTQAGLAEQAGLSTRAIEHLEAGRGLPYPDNARRLADALSLTNAERQRFMAAAQRPGRVRAAHSAQPPGDIPANNLPRPLTSFVGRQAEVSQLEALLAEQRLVTLTGPGGAGKTRLALHVAARLLPSYPGGVWFVPLASVADPDLVLPTILEGVSVGTEQSPRAALVGALGTDRVLLVLDNLEHLLGAAALITDLLAACANLTYLVTSQAALRVNGEQEMAVRALSLPEPGAGLPALLNSDAAQLFAQRARAIRPEFVLDETTADVVAEICRRLDGLPLAIELAAARVRLLPPPTLLRRLEHRLALLTDGPRDAPARHQTLRAAIDWSYELLVPAERDLLEQLGCCVDGWQLDMAEAIAGDENGDVLSGLESLAAKSLVSVVSLDGAEPRFSLLEAVREYALDRLTVRPDAAAIFARHARAALVLAEQAAAARREQPDGTDWWERLQAETGNLRAAMRWSLAHESSTALRLGVALYPFWQDRGLLVEGRQWLKQLLALQQAPDDPHLWGRLLTGAGSMAWLQGDQTEARAFAEQALAHARRLGDPFLLGRALSLMGVVSQTAGDLDRAEALYAESAEVRQNLPDAYELAEAYNALAEIARERGDYPRAWELYQRSDTLARGGGLTRRHNLGKLALSMGQLTEAEALFRQSLGADRRNRQLLVGYNLAGFGGVAAARGEAERAARLLSAAAALFTATGAKMEPTEQRDFDRDMARARAALPPERFAAAWAAGSRLGLADAVDEALSAPPITIDPAILP